MSEVIEITGGIPLKGTVKVSGAKNGALPLLMASLLTDQPVTFSNIPTIKDIPIQMALLQNVGAQVAYQAEQGTAQITAQQITSTETSYSLVRAIRGSFWVLAPLLAREGAVKVALPGGDVIGARPVDIHLQALEQMGAAIEIVNGVVHAKAPQGKLQPADISLRFPSVGATHQVLMAAALTPGETILRGAAREPEVVALAQMLTSMGAEISGAGTSLIHIQGRATLNGTHVALLGDRIEAGTYLLAAAATRGHVTVEGICPEYFGAFLDTLQSMGANLELYENHLVCSAPDGLHGVSVTTLPFPGVATDLQAPLMAALCCAQGESRIEETIFEGRFGHAGELARMGADIRVEGSVAVIHGVQKLSGASVEAHDIRAAAALILAGLVAEGTTRLYEPQHARRGYENIEKKLTGLGAKLRAISIEGEDFLFSGC